MNRRKFFRAAASFVAGCAIGVGLRPKIEPVPQWEGVFVGEHVHQIKVTPDYECMIFIDRDVKQGVFTSSEGVRSITYRQVDGEWIKDESTRKA